MLSLLLITILSLSACSSTVLQLAPEPSPQQQVLDGTRFLSRGFHDVVIAPRIEQFQDGPVLHVGIGLRNGSLLETPFDISHISAVHNDAELPLNSFERIHNRILAQQKEQLEALSLRQARLTAGYERSYGMGSSFSEADAWDPVTFGLETEHLQNSTDKRSRQIEEATKRKLSALETLYVKGAEIGGGQRFESFFEFPIPSDVAKGDTITIRVNFPPDHHEFRIAILEH